MFWNKKKKVQRIVSKDKVIDELLSKPNVHTILPGTKIIKGKNTNELAIKVLVEKKESVESLSSKHLIPKKIKGIKTDVEETPMFKALADRKKYRPIKGGIEISPKGANFVGTIGGLYARRTYTTLTGKVLSLNGRYLGVINLLEKWGLGPKIKKEIVGTTNLHVASSSVFKNPVGNKIVQPGVSSYEVGKVVSYEIMEKDGFNEFDLAVFKVNDGVQYENIITEIGSISDIVKPSGVEIVKKRGRTTLLTIGSVYSYPVSSRVNYGSDGTLKFKNVAIIKSPVGNYSDKGDSGADIINDKNELVYKLFAGGGGITLGFPMYSVSKKHNLSPIDLGWTVYIDDK